MAERLQPLRKRLSNMQQEIDVERDGQRRLDYLEGFAASRKDILDENKSCSPT